MAYDESQDGYEQSREDDEQRLAERVLQEIAQQREVPVAVDLPVSSSVSLGDVMWIRKGSLSETIDSVNEAMFEGRSIPLVERTDIAQWIGERQGLPGAYGDTFAGFPSERESGIVLFTGERITSASARHILGEEACRALRLLRVSRASVTRALERASEGLMRCLDRAALDPRNSNPGKYCCGKCTVGLWRHLLAGGLDRQEERLSKGVRYLRTLRDGQGRWRVFPFWYTVLALSEMGFAEAREDLQYAGPLLERLARRAPPRSRYALRRYELARRVLECA
jgi:hypothetical protein